MKSSHSKTPKRKASEKAEAILGGAMQEFMAHGYAAASMDQIAGAAGVSKPTLYNYFQDKESLFVALIEKLVQERFQDFFSAHQLQQQIPPGKGKMFLRQLAARILENSANDPQFLDFLRIIFGESGRFPELARTFVGTVKATAFESITQLFANCRELKVKDPEVAARIFVGTIVHYIITQKLLHGEEILEMDHERLIEGLIDCLTEK
ncbi:MAG: TetR/AcrR family transcriptional regulator [Lyngbya sp.]|nr:TetR/AcrR family transcriptional regulator [Lyngbya sp.]